ncbi:MAG: sterol desaturase family protein [Alphaproteobacteria bacterium]
MRPTARQILQPFITYAFYPLMLLLTGAVSYISLEAAWAPAAIYTYFAATRFGLLIGTEFLFPAKQKWKMTWRSFWRDIKYSVTNIVFMRGGSFLIALLALDLAVDNPGLLPNAPFIVGLVATALVYEFFQYWFHRWCHEGPGKIGEFLWKMHAAHHLPDKVYLVMHGVMHPLNALASTLISSGVVLLMGASQEALFVLLMFRGLNGWISHFNVDIRAGFLNYIFAGTELHRYHHSADFSEAKNYGSFIIFWDIVFGTFVYKPGRLPERLGVDDVSAYPESTELLKVLALPFRKSAPDFQSGEKPEEVFGEINPGLTPPR